MEHSQEQIPFEQVCSHCHHFGNGFIIWASFHIGKIAFQIRGS